MFRGGDDRILLQIVMRLVIIFRLLLSGVLVIELELSVSYIYVTLGNNRMFLEYWKSKYDHKRSSLMMPSLKKSPENPGLFFYIGR